MTPRPLYSFDFMLRMTMHPNPFGCLKAHNRSKFRSEPNRVKHGRHAKCAR